MSNQEGFDIAKSAKQVLANRPLGDLALVVVTAGLDTWNEGFPLNIARDLEEDWLTMQKEFLKLSRASKHIIATESFHAIQEYQPDLIVDIILQLLKVI